MYRMGIEELNAVGKVIETRALFKINDLGQDVMHAEIELQEKLNVKHALLMTSGHAGLESALVAMGIGPGDQVIVPAYTYIATALAVVGAGAIPVIVDINDSLTLDPKAFEAAITPKTKAVIPVHIQGFPCQMDEICRIAKEHNILVLEDACQADGGSFKGQRLATIGDCGAMSFNYFKIITAGEGGALFTNNKTYFERALIYQDSAAVAFFGNQLEGFETDLFCGTEYRSNGISAAILREQIKKLDDILLDLRSNKKYVMDALCGVCEFNPSNDIEGDCGTTIPFKFNTPEEAIAFKNYIGGTIPYETGKHVYTNWTPIMEKRGAFHPLMDPYKMEANKDIIPNYTKDMCQKSLDILCRVAYVGVSPDWTKAEMDEKIAEIKAALKA